MDRCKGDDEIFNLGDYYGLDIWVLGPKNSGNRGHFYGMELPRVGAFTEKWGS